MNKRALAVLAAVLSAHAAVAQTPAAPSRLEVLAGLNLANLSSTDDDGGSDNRAGLVAGVGLIKPLAPGWAFQSELTYSMKGAKSSDTGGDLTVKLSYLELPLLLRYDIGSQPDMRPFVHAGFAPALKLSCKFEVSNGTVSGSESCDDIGDDAKTFDLGFMFGGGLAFRHMDHTFSVGVRYNLGLLDIADGSDSKNRVLSIVGTFEWPWGK
jgi:hypothetical protein